MSSTALNVTESSPNFAELAVNLLGRSWRWPGSTQAEEGKNRPDIILVVEDSPTSAKLATQIIEEIVPGVPVIVVDTWMGAVEYLRRARLVVADWRLRDGVDAVESGAIELMRRCGIPFFVWAGTVRDVPSGLGIEVVAKSYDQAGFESAVRRGLKQAECQD